MAEKRYVDITRRKSGFNRIEQITYILLALFILTALVLNAVYNNFFAWAGWLAVGLSILLLISVRNYFYIKQLSAIEFVKPETYSRYQYLLGLALLGFFISLFVLPSSYFRNLLPQSIPNPFNLLFFFIAGLLSGLLCLWVNLNLPVLKREIELSDEEKEQVRKWRKELDDEWMRFQETNELQLQQLKNPGSPPPVDLETLSAIRERMDYIIKYLDHVRKNQYVIIARYDISGNKLLRSKIALRFFGLISVIVALKIIFL